MAQSAVNSLLGSLSSVLVGEAKLLIGVRGDVQFIRDEMESMKGFLQDLAHVDRPNNQVRAWMRQVQDLADDSESCISRYVGTFGSRRPRTAAGFLLRVPRLVQTIPVRHRIASEIRELKARACEVGERRKRYGVAVPSREPSQAMGDDGAAAAAGEAEDAWILEALVDAADSFDKSAREVVSWLIGPGGSRHSPEADDFVRTTADAMVKVISNDDDHIFDRATTMVKGTLTLLEDDYNQRFDVDRVGMILKRHSLHQKEELSESAALLSLLKLKVQDISSGAETKLSSADEVRGKGLAKWLLQVFGDVVKELCITTREPKLPKVIAIVTPPLDIRNPEEDDEQSMPGQVHTTRATEVAKRVYRISQEGKLFDCTAWVDAKLHCKPREMLECLFRQLFLSKENLNLGSLPLYMSRWTTLDNDMRKWTEERLKQEISSHLKGTKILIVVADHDEDSTPWKDMAQVLTPDCLGESVIIVTPLIKDSLQFQGWYMASWLLQSPRFKVHYHSNLDAACKKAEELLVRSDRVEDLRGLVKEILIKCRADPFSTKMVLHSLYASPHIQNKVDLEKLLLGLKPFNPVINAQHTIRFCYNTLPNHYKACLLYLSIFPKDSKKVIRRTTLIRRWAAENLITRRDGWSALDEAEHGFKALVTRGLVLPHDIDPQGKVKSCTVHPLVFSFIVKIACEENIGNTVLPPELAHRLSIRNGIRLQQLANTKQDAHSRGKTCWRLHKTPPSPYTHEDPKGSSSDTISVPSLMSLLSTTSQLGLIKVLDLESCIGLKKQHIKTICNKLFQLKYLSLRNTDVSELPKEIEKLQYLETLDIRQTRLQKLPDTIMLRKLVHLLAGWYIANGDCMSTINIARGIGSMTNIQTLSHVEVSESVIKYDLVRLQQLRKLGVVISLGNNDRNNDTLLTLLLEAAGKLDECLSSLSIHIIQSEVVVSLNTKETKSPPKNLDSLNINGKISELPTWIKDLHQLSKISLCHASLREDDIRILAGLFNLRCIILRHISCSRILTLKEQEFKKLEFLVIEGDGFTVRFNRNAAPKLVKVVWTFTGDNVILFGIKDLSSLRVIELHGNCDTGRIRADLEANGNHPVLIHKPRRNGGTVSYTNVE